MMVVAVRGLDRGQRSQETIRSETPSLWKGLARAIWMPAALGALPGLRPATDPQARTGQFYGPHGISPLHR